MSCFWIFTALNWAAGGGPGAVYLGDDTKSSRMIETGDILQSHHRIAQFRRYLVQNQRLFVLSLRRSAGMIFLRLPLPQRHNYP